MVLMVLCVGILLVLFLHILSLVILLVLFCSSNLN